MRGNNRRRRRRREGRRERGRGGSKREHIEHGEERRRSERVFDDETIEQSRLMVVEFHVILENLLLIGIEEVDLFPFLNDFFLF